MTRSPTPPVALCDPALPLPRLWLAAPGGFLWWYVDLVDASGNGLVAIWSYGLPFLPGYASAARAGRPELPSERPSLNLAVYQGGQLAFFVLHELTPDLVSYEETRDAARWRFGDTEIERRALSASEAGGTGGYEVRLRIDCPLPGTRDRVLGDVVVRGPACRLAPAAGGDFESGRDAEGALADLGATHLWAPVLGLSTGDYDLRAGAERYASRGARAYHDRNAGRVPLHNLGLDTWLWGRVSLPDEELVYYVLWSKERQTGRAPDHVLGFSLGADGTMRTLRLLADPGSARRARYGMPLWPSLTLHDTTPGHRPRTVQLQREHRVEDGPFYLRHLTRARVAGTALEAPGVEEIIAPDRIDTTLLRPLVRMRVSREGEPGSMWSPLFLGAQKGRVSRLLRSFVERRRG